MNTNKIPSRNEVPQEHRWNLSKLFKNVQEWEEALKALEAMIPKIESFKGTVSQSAQAFLKALEFNKEYSLLAERVGHYAQLILTEDEGNSESRNRVGRYMMLATRGQGAWSWLVPEIQKIPETSITSWLKQKEFEEYQIYVKKIIRYRPHVLSEEEERLLALAMDAATTPSEAFSVLTNVDMDFGTIDTPEGPRPLSQSTYSSFLHSKNRSLREKAYKQFYDQFDRHKNTLASLYSGSCKLDYYNAKVRKFASCRAQPLFEDDVPESVYDNLIATVSNNLPALHEYYELRKRVLKLDELKHYDVYVPLVDSVKVEHTWEQAVEVVTKALAPLGEEYVSTLKNGLLHGWADRYENKGKRSGAFSWGSYTSDPYIMMNFKQDVLRDVFTMAHEGGHSMHSWYSAKNNPFMHYNYTIFEAEVASTFNEALLFEYMYNNTNDQALKNYLLSNRIDDILATLFRQTMFAEFEYKAHSMLENGEPLTVDAIRTMYRKLLEKYFGPAMKFDTVSDLECLRIPHFYGAFYVYKYATGISASIALAKEVLSGEPNAKENYFKFLSSGGSRFPIEALKVAGVDMTRSDPIQAACDEFVRLIKEFKKGMKL